VELDSLLRVQQNHLNPLDGLSAGRFKGEAGSAGLNQWENKEIQGRQILQAEDLHPIGDRKGVV